MNKNAIEIIAIALSGFSGLCFLSFLVALAAAAYDNFEVSDKHTIFMALSGVLSFLLTVAAVSLCVYSAVVWPS